MDYAALKTLIDSEPANAGVLTTAVPTGSGEIVKVLGYAVTADQLFFDPDKTWIELE